MPGSSSRREGHAEQTPGSPLQERRRQRCRHDRRTSEHDAGGGRPHRDGHATAHAKPDRQLTGMRSTPGRVSQSQGRSGGQRDLERSDSTEADRGRDGGSHSDDQGLGEDAHACLVLPDRCRGCASAGEIEVKARARLSTKDLTGLRAIRDGLGDAFLANIAITLDTYSHVLPRMDEAAAATFGAMLRDAAAEG
jgi:hypothetical protein